MIVSGDAGGTRAIVPVVKTLRLKKRVRIKILAYAQAGNIWQEHNLPFEELSKRTSGFEARHWLGQSGAALVLAGTSTNELEWEKLFIAEANDLGVPSLAVLDFWTNYIARFSGTDGHTQFLPDRIAIMDEWARDEMILVGFDPSRLVITGQPAFDNLSALRTKFSLAQRQAVRIGLGVAPEEKLVLFASQPFSQLYGADPTGPDYLGYDELSVLQALVETLDYLAEHHAQRIVLNIRPHPRESDEALKAIKGRIVRVLVSNQAETHAHVMAADLVTGMNSILLMEACYLGCLVVSLQPELREADVLPTNRWRMSQAIYHYSAFIPIIEELLFNPATQQTLHKRLSHLFVDGLATQRVANLVYELTGLNGVQTCQN